jgi:hypothetical protein
LGLFRACGAFGFLGFFGLLGFWAFYGFISLKNSEAVFFLGAKIRFCKAGFFKNKGRKRFF